MNEHEKINLTEETGTLVKWCSCSVPTVLINRNWMIPEDCERNRISFNSALSLVRLYSMGAVEEVFFQQST